MADHIETYDSLYWPIFKSILWLTILKLMTRRIGRYRKQFILNIILHVPQLYRNYTASYIMMVPAIGRNKSLYNERHTQIYRRSVGSSCKTCFKNQYIFVLIMGARAVSRAVSYRVAVAAALRDT